MHHFLFQLSHKNNILYFGTAYAEQPEYTNTQSI